MHAYYVTLLLIMTGTIPPKCRVELSHLQITPEFIQGTRNVTTSSMEHMTTMLS